MKIEDKISARLVVLIYSWISFLFCCWQVQENLFHYKNPLQPISTSSRVIDEETMTSPAKVRHYPCIGQEEESYCRATVKFYSARGDPVPAEAIQIKPRFYDVRPASTSVDDCRNLDKEVLFEICVTEIVCLYKKERDRDKNRDRQKRKEYRK